MSNRPRRQTSRPSRGRPSAPDRSRANLPWIIGAGVVAVVVVAVVLAFALGGGDDGDSSTTTAPVIQAQTFDGEPVEIDPADGTARIVGFFAHWCPHCQAELPRLTEWLDANELPEGVEVVAVSTAVDPGQDNYPPSDWFAAVGWPELVLADSEDNAIAAGYELDAFPYFVVTSGDGEVVERTSGELSTDQWEELVQTAAAA